MPSQGEQTLSVTGALPPAAPSAYRFSEGALDARDLQIEQDVLSVSNASVSIQNLPAGPQAGHIKPKSTQSIGPVPLILEIENEDGSLVGLSGLSFSITQDETGEMTFSNKAQGGSLRLTVIAHPTISSMSFSLHLDYAGLNVPQALNGVRFFQALSRGGEFRMVGRVPGADAKLTVLRGSITAGEYAGPNPRLVKLLEQLALIQDKTGVSFTVPKHGASSEDAQNVHVVARIVETGRATYGITPWETTSDAEQAKEMLETFAGGKPNPIVMHYPEEQTMKLLGVDVPLGPMIISIRRTYMTAEDLEQLRSDLEASSPGGVIHARLSPFEDCPAEAHYMRWLPVEDAAAIYRMPVFQHEPHDQLLGGLLESSRRGGSISIPRFAELLAALRKDVGAGEASTANPIVACTPEELLRALGGFMKDLDQKARFVLAALLFKHDVLSSGKAARLAGMDRVTFLLDLHKVGVAVLDLDEEQMENQARYVSSR